MLIDGYSGRQLPPDVEAMLAELMRHSFRVLATTEHSGQTLNVLNADGQKVGFINDRVLSAGVLGYRFSERFAAGIDENNAVPAPIVDRVVEMFAAKYSCAADDFVIQGGAGSNAGRHFLVLRRAELATRILLRDADSNDERTAGADWSRQEVEAIVDDYLSMLASEIAGTPYNKAEHRRVLKPLLASRSDQSIEYKHANISAALLDGGFPYINGYKPRSNYQGLLAEIVFQKLQRSQELLDIAAADADRPIVVPEVDDILAILTDRPAPRERPTTAVQQRAPIARPTTNYVEREARNLSLGSAGEALILKYEQTRLIRAGHEALAAKIEHTSKVRGDHEGYDILSFEVSGRERLIEVKTTKYGSETPFFVTRNELSTSERHASRYQLYRLFAFRQAPRLYTLVGAIDSTCQLSAATFVAYPK